MDVGTGDGLLAGELREKVPEVVAIDSDSDVLDRARASGADVRWVHGDVMTHSLELAHYDLVAAIATVHHLPELSEALTRFADLAKPGGVVVVIGCARSSGIGDHLIDAVGVLQHQVLSRTRGFWQHTATTVTRFPHTYEQVRHTAADSLPGVRWRRLPLFRYALTWTKSG